MTLSGRISRLLSTGLLVMLISGCTSLAFQPKKEFVNNVRAKLYLPTDIYFRTPDSVTLHGWYFRSDQNKGSILVLHGNAENLSTHVSSILWLVDEGFNVFIFDYRGYGRSQGKPSIDGVHVDAEAALQTLFTLPGVGPDRTAVLGQSIGGAIAVYLLANSPEKNHVKALILESALSSYRVYAREKVGLCCVTWPFQYPLSFLISDYYSPVHWIQKVSPVPVLIIHGDSDPVVPLHHGLILYETALEPKEFWRTSEPGHIASFADPAVRKKLASYLVEKFNMPSLL